LPEVKINKAIMKKAASEGFLNATDMADYLAVRGMPFREAHTCAGKAVRYALDKKKELHQLSIKELQSFSSTIKEDIFKFLDTQEMINRRKATGGTAKENVMAAMKKAKKDLENKIQRLST
ncbi:MAG: argininosuccinate lyase, partial [Deltaproteobacteria bacterium]|nr:argininosuccinate lyase [Deltaproteobacteria bacterium]